MISSQKTKHGSRLGFDKTFDRPKWVIGLAQCWLEVLLSMKFSQKQGISLKWENKGRIKVSLVAKHGGSQARQSDFEQEKEVLLTYLVTVIVPIFEY